MTVMRCQLLMINMQSNALAVLARAFLCVGGGRVGYAGGQLNVS
jgi:hypothetical protein